jgi:hypothetical protein
MLPRTGQLPEGRREKSFADVVAAALAKFPDDPIHVERKGGSIRPVNFPLGAGLASTEW